MIVNCRSIRGKSSDFLAAVDYINPDCVLGTESWLDSNISNSEVFPSNYNIYRRDRNCEGGGVFVAVKSDFISSSINITDNTSEVVWAQVNLQGSKSLILGSYYRPPNSKEDSVIGLGNSFSHLPKDSNSKHIILGGDFNLPHINWADKSVTPSSPNTAISTSCLELIDNHNLEQLVDKPTRGGNILDLCLTNQPNLVNTVSLSPGISDHDIVIVDACINPKLNKKKPRTVFKYNDENLASVKRDLNNFAQTFLDSKPSCRYVNDNYISNKP